MNAEEGAVVFSFLFHFFFFFIILFLVRLELLYAFTKVMVH